MSDTAEINMLQYPTGRLRSFLVPGQYDWDFTELYFITEDLYSNLEDVDPDIDAGIEFAYFDQDTTGKIDSIEGLLENQGRHPWYGLITFEGDFSGEVKYHTSVPMEDDALLEANFETPPELETPVSRELKDTGFKKTRIPRLNERRV